MLNVAEHGTASHVERLVRKYRRVEQLEDAARANDAHRRRALHYFYDEDGSLVIRAKLPPEVGAIVKKALDAALAVLERDEAEGAHGAEAAARENGANQAPSSNGSEPEQSAAGTLTPTARRIPQDVSAETSEAEHERRHFDHDPCSARRADALRFVAEAFLTRQADRCGSAGDRYQVVVHVNQAVLARARARHLKRSSVMALAR